MTKPLEAQFYFGAVIDHDGECQRVSDEEAQFWTVYERNADGLSSAICDCTHRNDAVAATERFNALIAALERSNKLKETFRLQSNMFCSDANILRKRVARLEACQLAVKLPPHKFSECVNGLLEEAIAYAGTQQLLARLSARLSNFVKPDHAAGINVQGDE